jgi:hypothetical protein
MCHQDTAGTMGCAAAALDRGTEPEYNLFAVVAYVHAAAHPAGALARQACQYLAECPDHLAP